MRDVVVWSRLAVVLVRERQLLTRSALQEALVCHGAKPIEAWDIVEHALKAGMLLSMRTVNGVDYLSVADDGGSSGVRPIGSVTNRGSGR